MTGGFGSLVKATGVDALTTFGVTGMFAAPVAASAYGLSCSIDGHCDAADMAMNSVASVVDGLGGPVAKKLVAKEGIVRDSLEALYSAALATGADSLSHENFGGYCPIK